MRILLLPALLVSTFTAGARGQEPPPIPAAAPPGVIFVCNGSGGGYQTTNGLLKAIARSGQNFCVDTIPWSRFGSAPHDHDDHVGHFAGARQLSQKVLALRGKEPGRKIYVAGFSSGARVALEAMRTLPPNTVDRIFLFAPSVAFFYDLGPALRASAEGIDAFYSSEDNVLEGVVSVIGTADGFRAPAAGRIGFWLPGKNTPSYPLYEQKFRQYPWNPGLRAIGHQGNHYGWTEWTFMKAYIVPMLVETEMKPRVTAH